MTTPGSPDSYTDLTATVPHTIIEGGRRVTEEVYDFDGWDIQVCKGAILPSKCYCKILNHHHKHGHGHKHAHHVDKSGSESASSSPPTSGSSSPKEDSESDVGNHNKQCQVCKFNHDFHHLPEMVFPDNVLRLEYKDSGFTLEFKALDGMSVIDNNISNPIHIACSKSWKASKKDEGLPNEIISPYDWTFSTNYTGTAKSSIASKQHLIEVDPPERINMEKLKEREKILFYDELTLYEDELHDCGISNLGTKIRVMPSGIFILLRFFLRVDQVAARISDTRIYYETGHSYFLREQQIKELSLADRVDLPSHIITDPNLLSQHLPIIQEIREKITFK